ncbi:glycoside hydrolase family 16 protein, partial [Plicaturopsis crispa FD-325 SS-3]
FSLSPDPRTWGSDLSPDAVEADDDLHNPDTVDKRSCGFSSRGLVNLGFIIILCIGLVTLFAGYPIITYATSHELSKEGAFNIGGINSTGQVSSLVGNWGLIDNDTPKEAYTRTALVDGSEWDLVFSDEFNLEGRTFYPGDDPYWEAVDLHYWGTNNLEWYDPAAVTTYGGDLVITLEKKETHDLHYQGGMLNKFCFTGGYIETNVSLPGVNNIVGFWPAVWTMGNLGRAGYGASLDGTWPYTYDACDVGTAPNQTLNGQPAAALSGGDSGHGGVLSYMPGQRLSACTCAGESHPGPKRNGKFVGRAAPELDVFEAQVSDKVGQVSQSAQWAPFNAGYVWFNTSDNEIFANPSISAQNTYIGGVTQQATSVVTSTDQVSYEGVDGTYNIYGFEYVTWVASNTVSWTLKVAGLAADPKVEISARPVPQEPMYIIANLGMSTNFGTVDLEHLPFPAHLRIDYIRVYQAKDSHNIGCSPKDFPTEDYINTYLEAYTNPNLTTWVDDYKQPWPKSSFLGQC